MKNLKFKTILTEVIDPHQNKILTTTANLTDALFSILVLNCFF